MAANDVYKKQAAEAAVELIQSDMVLGLGHGSTVQFALETLANKLQSGNLKHIVAIPCSKHTEAEMRRLGIPLGDLNAHASIDLTIDGADEVDPQYNLIKGGGGALLREKIVAQSSQRNVIIVDEGKLSSTLGTKHTLPLEVIAFGWERQRDFVAKLGGKSTLRVDAGGNPVLTDQGNYLLDCEMGPIADPAALAQALEARSGILEHGLFLGLANDVIVAGASGLRHLKAKPK
ncbi:MAG: ribose-5-phosphate isomerase RpiA [Chloroflexi bacterium]|nr:ribose-5-phosphate isomerase RpiA [Chloroflexota bacterium]